MENVYVMLDDQIKELVDEYTYAETDEGSIQLYSAIVNLATARDNLRRAIRAERVAAEKRYEE